MHPSPATEHPQKRQVSESTYGDMPRHPPCKSKVTVLHCSVQVLVWYARLPSAVHNTSLASCKEKRSTSIHMGMCWVSCSLTGVGFYQRKHKTHSGGTRHPHPPVNLFIFFHLKGCTQSLTQTSSPKRITTTFSQQPQVKPLFTLPISYTGLYNEGTVSFLTQTSVSATTGNKGRRV